MALADELTWRGFVNQMTFKEISDVNQPRTFYFGVDPSADSMTVGNLAAAMMCRHFIDHGHKAILLVGGATGMIGDPDGKKQERDLKSLDEIARNKAAITEQYKTLFDGKDFEIVDNYDWFKEIGYLDFLRDVGKHVPMTQMLDRDFVKSRVGEGGDGISYAEFSYSLIQGYDFLHLYRRYNATLQVAGADQWGNSIAGVQLIRRLEGSEAHVFTVPLVVNKQTGVKFGKSEGGAVWLDPNKTSPFKFYQFWLNVDDETALSSLGVYTVLDQGEIASLKEQHMLRSAERIAQRQLAYEVTGLVHGAARRDAVEKVTAVLFGSAQFETLNDADKDELGQEIPTVMRGTVVAALIESGTVSSNGEARRLITSGAIALNGVKVTEDFIITESSLLKKGKNTFVLVR